MYLNHVRKVLKILRNCIITNIIFSKRKKNTQNDFFGHSSVNEKMGIESQHIGNIDEVTISVKIILYLNADEVKCAILFIFNRKTILKEVFFKMCCRERES